MPGDAIFVKRERPVVYALIIFEIFGGSFIFVFVVYY